jgi:glycyl-tRNA synthetase alpha chain
MKPQRAGLRYAHAGFGRDAERTRRTNLSMSEIATTSTTKPTQADGRRPAHGLDYQRVLLNLQDYWAREGCILQLPYDLELGAGTMSPETFLRVLGPQPYKVAYLQPSRRPADGRYGENPNRLYKHTQLQVILKPPPEDVLDLYLRSLEAIGIELEKHDIKFEEDNWESPTLGAWGLGWQVMLDGLEITQFTYFQQAGGMDLDPISAEITYGLERITAFLQDVESVYDIRWNGDFTYRDVRFADELQMSVYNFEQADVAALWQHFELYEAECRKLLAPLTEKRKEGKAKKTGGDGGSAAASDAGIEETSSEPAIARVPVLAAYELCLKCSHIFNLLDARGAISVTERVGVIQRVRNLAVMVARAWTRQRGADEAPAGGA